MKLIPGLAGAEEGLAARVLLLPQRCLPVTRVPSPCAQPAAAITIVPEAERDQGVGFFSPPSFLFKATLHSSAVAGREVELGRTRGAPVGNVLSL